MTDTTQNIIKKGLLIGINYKGTSNELNGCINDVENLEGFLVQNNYFESCELTTMHDNKKDINNGLLYPTKKNIIQELNNLLKFCTDQDPNQNILLFLSYSGHGSYMTDTNNDELDGRDEVLCPVDCHLGRYITDDYLKESFIDKLPENVKFVILIDSCHSGTMMDLKFNHLQNNLNQCVINPHVNSTKCHVIMISGSMDSQTSADAYLVDKINNKYEYQGAMTASFIANFKDDDNCLNLITKMRTWLKNNKFEQIPQLSSGKVINVNNSFLLSEYND